MDLLSLASDLPVRTVAPGETLIVEGEQSGAVLVVIDGSFEVRRHGVTLAVVDEPGTCLGELSVLLDQPHHASVVATTVGHVRVADAGGAFLRRDPDIALLVARILAHRLDVVNAYLADLRDQYADAGGHLSVVHEVLADLATSRPRAVEIGSEREPDPRY